MRELSITIPVTPGISFTDDDVVVNLTRDDAIDLNTGASITTLTPSGEEVALFPYRRVNA